MTASPSDPDLRIAALEEAVGFSEHRAAKLDVLVAELSVQIFDLSNKLERMEKRLEDLKADVRSGATGEVPNDPPPHSHRPL